MHKVFFLYKKTRYMIGARFQNVTCLFSILISLSHIKIWRYKRDVDIKL